jgi:hypothetical protein
MKYLVIFIEFQHHLNFFFLMLYVIVLVNLIRNLTKILIIIFKLSWLLESCIFLYCCSINKNNKRIKLKK